MTTTLNRRGLFRLPAHDQVELNRHGLLLMAATQLSAGKYVSLQYIEDLKQWTATVRLLVEEHTEYAATLLLALDRAVQWLRIARQVGR